MLSAALTMFSMFLVGLAMLAVLLVGFATLSTSFSVLLAALSTGLSAATAQQISTFYNTRSVSNKLISDGYTSFYVGRDTSVYLF